jgi:hypothetical protein
MITKEGFIQSTGIEPEKAEQLYNNLNKRFDGDWNKAAEYLKDLYSYLEKHQQNVS